MHNPELLLPDPTNPRELKVFDKIPDYDRQAWLYFLTSSYEKEQLGIGPDYTFDQFNNGLAEHIPGFVGIIDDQIEKGFNKRPLVPNFREPSLRRQDDNLIPTESLLSAFEPTKSLVEKALEKGPLALIAPHTSLASPYAVARSFIETHGHDIATRLYIVIGPRPTVIQFEYYDNEEKEIRNISPVSFGRAEANVLLTGPDTDSTRNNEQLHEWLKDLKKDFWNNYNEVTESGPGGNNVIIFCPAGRVAEEQPTGKIKEYRVDGSFKYLFKKNLRVLPVGIYDRLLSDPINPESIVFINPDKSVWQVENENQAQWLHERAVALSCSPLGTVAIESSTAQNFRLTKQKVRKYVGKDAVQPYLAS